MQMRFKGTVGGYSKDAELRVKQDFELPQSEGESAKTLNDLNIGAKLFASITCDGKVYQLGYVQLGPYKRDAKGAYHVTVTSTSSAYKAPPDTIYGKELRLMLIEPQDLELELERLKQEEVQNEPVA